jgi:VWFA-related protein
LFRESVTVEADIEYLAVTVEEIQTGLWGGALALPGRAIATAVLDNVMVADRSATSAKQSGPSTFSSSAQSNPIVKLLPPTKRPVTGRVQVRTLVTTTAVDKARFWLNEKLVSTDTSAPFSAHIDFGSQPQLHTVKVEVFAVSGAKLGEDSLSLNKTTELFRVAIGRVTLSATNEVEGEVDVTVPFGKTLDRLEITHNDTLVATLGAKPPFKTRFATAGVGAADFVSAVAYLSDGSSLEDARLISSQTGSERVNVNLVELFVVATDRSGEPVNDLAREDFKIKLKGRPQEIERFELAEEQPLVLGVVVDTSESMWTLMPDTKKAATKFLSETVQTEDRAFLVDFDTRPRLAQATTDDLGLLFRKFAGLRASGFTALYDAIIFSLLQFEETSSRRALVLLSDGDDYKSEYSARKCIQYGRSLGVPVYIIAMGGIHDPRRGMRKTNLEGITEATGGRIHYISAMADLDSAYGQINRELRSQYILAFSTDQPLSDEQLDSIKLEIPGRKALNVRTAIGRSTR